MHSRRDFIRNAAALTGAAFIRGSIPEAVARAFEIDPDQETTYLDAEHVVILMQENRSFDHCYGALRGVRGFRDPRAHVQPNGRKVWFQSDKNGEIHAPFRLDIKETNVTWIGGLPHSWTDQVDARNGGKYDNWLIAKARKDLPLTMGHYTRDDLPFYYALADAFTVCDQAFCSSLTGTTPNRLFLWTGTIRKNANDPARVVNGDTDYGSEADWTTYPERLEDAGISWRIYQNEISLDSGFVGQEDAWLSNFTDNPIEWFSQYRVRFSKTRRIHIANQIKLLPDEIKKQEAAAEAPGMAPEEKAKIEKNVAALKARLSSAVAEQEIYHDSAWDALPAKSKAIHEKAFSTNTGDPDYRTLADLTYDDDGTERKLKVPAGDVLHQFRHDVDSGKLPKVSWIIAPETFSDHPGSAWFGAWYVSEVMNILTKNPEVWKKTIFVLCYDENDGYFDHVPPFIAPHPGRPETGKVSNGIDTAVDVSDAHGRDHSIGLGFRCPLVVASPWSRGGNVNSQVFDHTSVLQLLERWLEAKGTPVRETNISDWRRTVCGDLTSVFRPYKGEKYELPKPLDRDTTIIGIHKARFKSASKAGKALTADQIHSVDVGQGQEPGVRPSCPLPYEMEANGRVSAGRFEVTMEAGNKRFGNRAAGSPFNAYSYSPQFVSRAYAVQPGDRVEDGFEIGEAYHVRIDGPNGFMREFRGNTAASPVSVAVRTDGDRLEVQVAGSAAYVEVVDRSYGAAPRRLPLKNGKAVMKLDPAKSHGWYDFSVLGGDQECRYAGRLETGRWSTSDPAMGR